MPIDEQQNYTSVVLDELLGEITKESQDIFDFKMQLAEKIYNGMIAKGWTQTVFAKQAAKQDSVITKWLSGSHNFELDTLLLIQSLLDIRLLDLSNINNKKQSVTSTSTLTAVTKNYFLMPKKGENISFPLEEGGAVNFEATVQASQPIETCDTDLN